MAKKLFLLDGMALVYRAHFALIARPIFTSKGFNTSAIFVFTQTLLDILNNQQPTHIAVVFDTEAPTQRHKDFADYKSQRETMPEELSQALPHIRRLIESFNIPVITCDGYEADDLIGTLVRRAEKESFISYMVTPDKDFGQLVSEKTLLYRPSRMGDAVEILGVPEILNKWGITRPEQVIDILGLWGDTSDNIPGVPGIGEKTASKLIAQYGTIENILEHTAELKGKLKETLETHREQALLSKRLATIICDAPCEIELEKLRRTEPNEEQLKAFCTEFELNSIGRRLFGDQFRAGRGFQPPPPKGAASSQTELPMAQRAPTSPDAKPLGGASEVSATAVPPKKLADRPHDYQVADSIELRHRLVETLSSQAAFSFKVQTWGEDPKQARMTGLGFSWTANEGAFVPLPRDSAELKAMLSEFVPLLENERIEKVGHDLKFDLSVLKWHGYSVRGKLFDTMIAHSLIEPDQRHSLQYLAEAHLGYDLSAPATDAAPMLELEPAGASSGAAQVTEQADVAWQLRGLFGPLLRDKGQERVFYTIEAPLIPVLVDMEVEGIRIDSNALAEIGDQLAKQIAAQEREICRLAGREFNLNSPRQLGEILFDILKICESPKKTKTGQYATDEQTLLALAGEHEIVRRLLDHRTMTKLKSTYVDTLPQAIWPRTGRVHTTFFQVATATGRLNSQNPNLQNIPIRSEQGREIRKAFVPRDDEHRLLSADYSQIELRIIAALSREPAMLEAFHSGVDIHTATAARVYGVNLPEVNSEMRRKAKMVNYGIAYGMSAFGLSQRLGIPRKEAAAIIDQYFAQFPGIRKYMSDTVVFARENGYVETITGRRRYLRDIRSANATVRNAAERNAINAPIQGSAADMIKIAMAQIHRELVVRGLKTRMVLQVHDELLFDLHRTEEKEVLPLIEEKMKTAIDLDVPIVVEMGTGRNWLEAH
jgi:DNA polymerase I